MPKLPFLRSKDEKRKKVEKIEKKGEEELTFENLFEEEVTFYHIQRARGVTYANIGGNYSEVESYPLNPPWAYARIMFNRDDGSYIYALDEVRLSPLETRVYSILVNILIRELSPPPSGTDTMQYFKESAKGILKKYMIRLGRTPGVSWAKMMYYIERDVVGYGYIDSLMRDPNIEDISCDGVGKPIYVWHRKYESLPTNIKIDDEEALDSFLVKLSHMAGAHISVAFPIVDAILPGGHRLAGTFKKEVTTKGSSFTVRKFSEDPITLVDMIGWNNLSEEMSAYLWLMLEHKMTGLVLGVTGSGKTTSLNAIASLIRPSMKVVTIEDTPELRLPLENWVQLVTRQSYGIGSEKIGEINLFDLIKVSLRYRPDYIIVGEVRGEEAYSLMQAVATGHGGLTTLHAESVVQAINRLTSEPMNIPKSFVPFLNFAFVTKRQMIINPDGTFQIVRRITNLWEIYDYGDYVEIFRWDPNKDKFYFDISKSENLKKIAEMRGKDMEWIEKEIENRKLVLRYLRLEKKRFYLDIAKYVRMYYQNPEKLMSEVRGRLEGRVEGI
ncbi:type II/IV secretion system ATPase subunit [Fervidicoccus fontis]|uniref:Type II/IV secretion system ATPase subunit n=1 Tax=Fervidicoccus fontis TaxID=683846 RepID=A0A843AB52_9CREN|nr:type II/IV secretion system ATPase subunit [Fervidicoccus fontis]MBE9391264.1 type II/IV secretion system ATPase subunit [Fervidicoccus fontis]